MSSNPFSKNSLVFTLDNTPLEPTPEQTAPADDIPDWERSLERLRRSKYSKSVGHDLPIDDIFATGEATVPASVRSAAQPVGAQLKPAAPSSVLGQGGEPLLDPVQRDRVYRAYLQQWQHQRTLEQEQQQSALNDTAVLLQEDWLAAQECLQRAPEEGTPSCTIRLQADKEAVVLPVEATTPTDEADEDVHSSLVDDARTAVTHVHLHVLEPQGRKGRAVICLSEAALLARLNEKLRPHLADAMAGMVRVAVQKQTAQLVSQLQQQLLADIPATVEDILQHNLHRIMTQIKQEQQH